MKMSVHHSKLLDAAEELALFEQWRLHRKGRAQIIEASLSLVAAIAREFRCTSSDRSNLIAEGCLALLTAFERFDPARGVRFATYARHWVSAAMKAYLGRAQNALGSRAYARMNAKLRREASLASWSDGGFNANAGLSANTAGGPWGGRDLSLDAPLARDATTTLLDSLAADSLDADAKIESERRKAIVNAAVAEARSTFDSREQVIFDVRFMADEDDLDNEHRTATTLDHAARKLGLSRERVRQLEERVRRNWPTTSERRSPMACGQTQVRRARGRER